MPELAQLLQEHRNSLPLPGAARLHLHRHRRQTAQLAQRRNNRIQRDPQARQPCDGRTREEAGPARLPSHLRQSAHRARSRHRLHQPPARPRQPRHHFAHLHPPPRPSQTRCSYAQRTLSKVRPADRRPARTRRLSRSPKPADLRDGLPALRSVWAPSAEEWLEAFVRDLRIDRHPWQLLCPVGVFARERKPPTTASMSAATVSPC